MEDCIFCKIIKKEIPVSLVFENEKIIAFNDINPQAPVHILIIPKKHIPTLLDFSKKDISIIQEVFLNIPSLVCQFGIKERGFRIVMNCNQDAGQSVFHLHFHLLGGRKFSWPPG